MKKLIIAAMLLLGCLNNSMANSTDSTKVVLEGKTFMAQPKSKSADKETGYTWKDSKGVEYPIYLSAKDKAYIIRISKKTGNEYKYYLPDDVANQIKSTLK